ncbi:MAG: iron dependent repressor, metal binding and dimerization domain protein, partial [Planctomycetota bacterium]
AIAEFTDTSGDCRGKDLSERFQVTAVTVNRTVARLVRDGFVTTEPYGPIKLTSEGRELAERVSQRHETVLSFLLALGVSEAAAVNDAEGIEHHVCDETLSKMRQFIQGKSQ